MLELHLLVSWAGGWGLGVLPQTAAGTLWAAFTQETGKASLGNFCTMKSNVRCPQKDTWRPCGMNMQLPTSGVRCCWISVGKKKEQKPTVQHFNNIFYLEKVLKSQDSHDGQRFLGETAFPCCPQAVPAALHFPSTTSPQSLLCLKEHSSLPSTALDLSMAFGVCFTCSEGGSLAGAGLLRSVTAAQPLTAVSPVLHCCKLPPIETNSASSNWKRKPYRGFMSQNSAPFSLPCM